MATKAYTIINGDSAQELKNIKDNTIDAVVTDPPYGIEFLGKQWDSNTGAVAIWAECHRILKPGGYLLAFSAARTYHHLATNIESVGFEIRDQLMWIYSSGFPKAQDMGRAIQRRMGVKETKKNPTASKSTFNNVLSEAQDKQRDNISDHSKPGSAEQVVCTDPEAQRWEGWKTALKPAHEPIVMARKPFKGSTTDNILQHGVGALNIDATRIPFEGKDTRSGGADGWSRTEFGEREPAKHKDQCKNNEKAKLEAWANKWSSGKSKVEGFDVYGNSKYEVNSKGRFPSNVMGDIPDYQKYFYCPKVSRRERHCGFEQHQIPDPLENYQQGDVKNHPLWDPSIGTNLQRLKHKILEHEKSLGRQHSVTGAVGNNHPTVKPVALMRYLIQLVTPPNSHIVDPFTGSGTTGMAALELGHRFTGIEQDPHYVEIANKRIEGWISTQGRPAQPTHIPAPFGSIKGCYDQGERFAVRHQQLQKNTATAKTDPFDRLFEQD